MALNRAIAIAQRDGPAGGLAEIESISDQARLMKYPFYFTAIGEFELRLGREQAARKHFEAALKLARSPAEKRFLQERVRSCRTGLEQ